MWLALLLSSLVFRQVNARFLDLLNSLSQQWAAGDHGRSERSCACPSHRVDVGRRASEEPQHPMAALRRRKGGGRLTSRASVAC